MPPKQVKSPQTHSYCIVFVCLFVCPYVCITLGCVASFLVAAASKHLPCASWSFLRRLPPPVLPPFLSSHHLYYEHCCVFPCQLQGCSIVPAIKEKDLEIVTFSFYFLANCKYADMCVLVIITKSNAMFVVVLTFSLPVLSKPLLFALAKMVDQSFILDTF